MACALFNSLFIRFSRVGGIGLLVALTTATVLQQPSNASNATFFCGQSKGVPVTYARTQDRRKVPMIRWVESFSPKMSPLERCKQVSYRFQRNYDQGVLNTIITGKMNGHPVVCAAESTNDDCTERTLLFTLKPGTNAKRVVERLLDRNALAAGKILNQSTDNTQIYIDFNIYLHSLPSEP